MRLITKIINDIKNKNEGLRVDKSKEKISYFILMLGFGLRDIYEKKITLDKNKEIIYDMVDCGVAIISEDKLTMIVDLKTSKLTITHIEDRDKDDLFVLKNNDGGRIIFGKFNSLVGIKHDYDSRDKITNELWNIIGFIMGECGDKYINRMKDRSKKWRQEYDLKKKIEENENMKKCNNLVDELKGGSRKNPKSKCPFNNDIECTAGVFCDGCKHEFDDKGGI